MKPPSTHIGLWYVFDTCCHTRIMKIFFWKSWLSVSIISCHYILGYLRYISIQKDVTTIWGFPKMVNIPQNTPIVNHFFVGKPMVVLGKPTIFGNTHIFTQFAPLGGGFKYFLFSSLPEEMIQFDDHIFQMGWNHQLDPHFRSNLPKNNKNCKPTDFLFQRRLRRSAAVLSWILRGWSVSQTTVGADDGYVILLGCPI